MSDLSDDLLDDEAADRLLAELGDMFAGEVTDQQLRAATNAFWIARSDALIAEVEEHLASGQRAGVRGGPYERQHVYRRDTLSVSLTVDSADRVVAGRLEGGWVSARWLDASGSSQTIEVDEDGQFRVSPRGGPAAVEVALVDGRRVRTSWTLL